MTSSLNDGIFVYTPIDSNTASLGDISVTNGNAFVLKTAISGVVSIPPVIGSHTIVNLKTYCFRYCDHITKLNLPNSLISMDAASLTTLISIKEVIIPSSVVTMSNLIDYFTIATKFIFEPGCRLTTIGTHFLQYSPCIVELVLPPFVNSIGQYFCYYCQSLNSVYYCGSNGFDNILNSFQECPMISKVIVSKEYPVLSFGSITVSIRPYNECNIKTISHFTCYINFVHDHFNILSSQFLFVFLTTF